MLRKLIPVLLGLVALLGGGAAGWMLRPAPPAAADAGHTEAADARAAASEGAAAPDAGHAPVESSHEAPPDAHAAPAEAPTADGHGGAAPAAPGGKEYVKLNNQFVVPLIDGGRVASMVILGLSLEVTAGSKDRVYAVEPKLRDLYLRVMFDHANAGGFAGTFTDRSRLDALRATLAEVSRPLLGDSLSEVLIEDIVRQDNG